MYFLGVLFVAIGISVSIALHEVGHLLPAKRFGVKVTHYMVGFGPTIWSRTRGETEYGLKAIPLGGFIRMIGMFPPKPGADPSMLRSSSTGRFSQLMDQARQESMEQVKPGDEDRVFYKLSAPRKLVVMLGGPTMNLIIAVVLLGGIVTLYGIGEITARVSAVSQCVQTVQANGTAPPTCSPSDPKAPANVAGIRPGDRVISLAGQPVSRWDDVRALVRPNGGRQINVVVERDGRQVALTATPILNNVPRVDAAGNLVLGPDGKALTDRVGFMGFSPSAEIVRQPLTAVPAVIGDQLTRTAGVVFRIPQKMAGIAKAAFGGGVRDPNGPMSVVGVGRVAGEVADGQLSGVTGSSSVSSKLVFLISLIASLNIALFVFNLIPLLPLDGGHAAGALWEGLKRQVARLRGRPNPGYVDVAKALPVAYAVSVALIGMSVLLIYADLVNPIKIGG
ncbi:MAG TPA: site-2 protease family protein [Dermatophilaceae bacterium]|jgi:membrane-associated protease RseP (regulator of RpoE activity)